MIIVVGHKSPDTDSVVSAKMFDFFLKSEGKESRPAVTGELNRETEFVFSFLEEGAPPVVTEKEIKECDFFLVDHNDLSQSVARKENIYGVLDHHLLSGFKTDKPLFFRIEPVGSTATLIYKMIKERGVEIEKKHAGLLLAGVISDTLNLNSPATTSEDIDFYYELSEIAEIDPNKFAEEMFEAKSDFSGKDVKDVIRGDMKEYDFGGKKIGVGVAETTSLKYFQENEEEVKEAVEKTKKEEGFDVFFFGAVDIIKQNTLLYPAGEEEKKVVREVFKGDDRGKFFLLKGVSSRKNQIAPPLSEYYNK